MTQPIAVTPLSPVGLVPSLRRLPPLPFSPTISVAVANSSRRLPTLGLQQKIQIEEIRKSLLPHNLNKALLVTPMKQEAQRLSPLVVPKIAITAPPITVKKEIVQHDSEEIEIPSEVFSTLLDFSLFAIPSHKQDSFHKDFQKFLAQAGIIQIDKKIGEGSFGVVFSAKKADGQEVTLKLFRVPQGDRLDHPWEMKEGLDRGIHLAPHFGMSSSGFYYSEIESKFLGKNYSKLAEATSPEHASCLVAQVLPHYTALSRVSSKRPNRSAFQSLEEKTVIKIAEELLIRQVVLQQGRVLHCDIHPENIYLDQHGRALFGDLDTAIRFPDKVSSVDLPPVDLPLAGCEAMIAPERAIATTQQWMEVRKADCFTLGCTLFCLITGKSNTQFAQLIEEEGLIFGGEYADLVDLIEDHPLKEILRGMLQSDPEKRLFPAVALKKVRELANPS